MGYMTTEEVKSVRKVLKNTFPKSKFSVRKGDSGVTVSVLKHDIDFSDKFDNDDYIQVNYYYIDRNFNNKQAKFLNKIETNKDKWNE